VVLPPGTGPRHLCPDLHQGSYWVHGELRPCLYRIERVADGGYALRSGHDIARLAGIPGLGGGSAIHLHPNGRWLVLAYRDPGVVVVVDRTATPRVVGRLDVTGDQPRDVAISERGGHLLVAAQARHRIRSHRLHDDGALSAVPDSEIAVGSPTCLLRWQR
jgi:6-phosphogluconolactonase (cycloisomerase 2 family)